MSRDRAFTVFLLLVVAAAVWATRDWAYRAYLFPRVIGIPLITLLVLQLVFSLRSSASPVRASSPDDTEAAIRQSRSRVMTAWLAGFAAAVWIIGFPLGGTLGTLAYLKTTGRERWPLTLAITAGTAVFFILSVRGLNIPYPRGLLFELLGLEVGFPA